MIDERTGCAVLREAFEAAGVAVREHCPLDVAGATIHLDGFDPLRRVGYEYITTQAGDRAEITPEIVAELEASMRRGDLFVLLVDEREVASAAVLARAAEHFLGVLRAKGLLDAPRGDEGGSP